MINCDNLEVVPFDGVGAELRGLELSSSDGAEEQQPPFSLLFSSPSSSLSSPTTASSSFNEKNDEDNENYCLEKFRALWNEHSVLLIRDQSFTEHSLLRLALTLGDPKPAGSRGYYMRAGHPHGSGRTSQLSQVSVMSNLDADGRPVKVTSGHGSQFVDWHQDDSYTNAPARGALLYNTHHPVNGGGNTSFCNLYVAYETLPEHVQELIAPWHLIHDISRNSAGHVRPGLELPQTWDEVEGPAHPLVIVHPVTGRKALHLGRKQPSPSSFIPELPTVEGHALLDYLWHHAITEAVWTHDTWRPGDLVLWDNLATMHKRSSLDPTQRREMLRVLLRGAPLVGVTPDVKTIPTTANDRADHEARVKDAMLPDQTDAAAAVATTNVNTTHNQTTSCSVTNTSPGTTDASFLVPDTIVEPVVGQSWSNTTMTTSFCAGLATLVLTMFSRLRRRRQSKSCADKTGTTVKTRIATLMSSSSALSSPSSEYLAEPRIQVFWWTFLVIYFSFQSFSCGRADRLWRISDVYEATPRVLLKPYGISYLWYEALAPYMVTVETLVLIGMVVLSVAPVLEWQGVLERFPARRWLTLGCGLGWLYLHGYEHSLTGGSHTHLMPAVCMVTLALPPQQSMAIIRQWNVFLLFSAGLCKLFNGSHHSWWAWMDGQSMQFYFENSRQPVPEPFNTWTMPPNHWFAATQCTLSALFELSTVLLLVSQSYRIAFPFMGAMFHGMIWYTLGINYFTSVIIQFTLVLDQDDWKCLSKNLVRCLGLHSPRTKTSLASDINGKDPATTKHDNDNQRVSGKDAFRSSETPSQTWAVVPVLNALLLLVVIVQQMEFWPLSNIPMYSGYRPHVGYNTTHITNHTYLDHLILETAPHVWSRHWTDVMLTDHETGRRSKMAFCARSRQGQLARRGMKDLCLIPEGNMFDTERHTGLNAGEAFRVEPPKHSNEVGVDVVVRHSMRPGGWGRQNPLVIMAELPGRYHVYCRNEMLSPAQDWLFRNCAFLHSMGIRNVEAELVVHLGTGDLVVASLNCSDEGNRIYPVDRVPLCIQSPWERS